MTYPHGGKYSNDPYYLTPEEEQRLERERMPQGARETQCGDCGWTYGTHSPTCPSQDDEEAAIAAGITWHGRTCSANCGWCGRCT